MYNYDEIKAVDPEVAPTSMLKVIRDTVTMADASMSMRSRILPSTGQRNFLDVPTPMFSLIQEVRQIRRLRQRSFSPEIPTWV